MHNVETRVAEIPALGFGTWDLRGDVAAQMVEAAIEIGYRHIDTAQAYGNEAEVGQGIKRSGIARDQLFLTTKIWPDNFRDGDLQRAAQASVERLGTVPDLLLLHWPNREVPLKETIDALNDVLEKGLTRHAGVSNFTKAMVEAALARCAAPLVTNQVEYHPFLTQKTLMGVCRDHDMMLTAYCPLARGKVLDDPVLAEIGRTHGKSGGQVALRWLVQQDDVSAIPRSSKRENAESNFAIFDFTLSAEEMQRISALGSPEGRLVNLANHAPDWDKP